MTPRSPGPGEPSFDLAWQDGATIYVAEVKSLTNTNQEKQLRLALGQVLRYRHLLETKRRPVVAIVAVEFEPAAPSWMALCGALSIVLAWPPDFAGVLVS
jgi:hypothetical protein